MPEIGLNFSHYRIVEKIGQGGMGEVYLADDTTLDRKVALKFLPEAFTSDPERMARFEREAKLLASLNHPNIAGIYGLEQFDGNRFLVLEYVEGETLQSRLSREALPLEETLAICRQIAEGLEAAHEKGVIHRDLKPANVMITAEEKVKILDFGLAKALVDDMQSIDSSQSPTLTEAMTRPGVILGTAAYMSPEQAKGKRVDKRADIWAFGCILYECLTGKRAFEGETVTETLAAVIKEEPDWGKIPATASQTIYFVLTNCLAREKQQRFQSAADVRILLEKKTDIKKQTEPLISRPSLFAWCIAILCLVGTIAFAFLYFQRLFIETPRMHLEISTPQTSEPASFTISPNGLYLVFAASSDGIEQLYLRPMDRMTAHPLPGTEGAINPFWSADSRSIGFFAESKLKRIDISEGRPQGLTNIHSGFGGAWNSDGDIVFAPSYSDPLFRISDSGGEAEAITKLDPPRQTSHWFPQFLPDGRHLLFYSVGTDQGVYVTSLDSGLDSDETKFLFESESPAVYTPPGYLLFIREGALFALRFNASSRDIEGDPVRIVDEIATDPRFGKGVFSVSSTGVLVYRTGIGTGKRQLAWFDRKGNEIGLLGDPDEHNPLGPQISPNSQRVAVSRTVDGNMDLYLIETALGVPNRFTFDAQVDIYPTWSHDGTGIIFSSSRDGIYDIYRKTASGAGSAELLRESTQNKFPYDISPDGRFLLYMQVDPETDRDLWVLPLNDASEPFPFVNTPFQERNGQFSHDGRWIAYQSNETGQFEVYVQPFPDKEEGKWQISTDGGNGPRWSRNGREIFYIAPNGMLMAASTLGTDTTFEHGVPEELFQTHIVHNPIPQREEYDVASDGRFLINVVADDAPTPPINVVVNWTRALEE